MYNKPYNEIINFIGGYRSSCFYAYPVKLVPVITGRLMVWSKVCYWIQIDFYGKIKTN